MDRFEMPEAKVRRTKADPSLVAMRLLVVQLAKRAAVRKILGSG